MTTTESDAPRNPWTLLWWLAALGTAVWLLARLGSGALATPPAGDPSALRGWYAERTPPEALLATLRLVALALGWYLLAVTAVGAVARTLGAVRLVAAADVLTVPAVRRLLRGTVGMGLAAASLVSLPGVHTAAAELADPPLLRGLATEAPAGAHPPPALDLPVDGPEALQGLGPPPYRPPQGSVGAGAVGASTAPAPDPAASSMPDDVHGAAGAADDEGGDPDDEGREAAVGGEPGQAADADDPSTHTVEAGEHLWLIAEQALTRAWDRAPADAEVVPYWQQLIDRNRDRLPDPGNPDLVHPGLGITLPDLPPHP